jgi:hypothetical protein
MTNKPISIKELASKVPLYVKLKVINEMAFISLLTELGYREDKSWGDDENERLSKLMKLAEQTTDEQFDTIRENNNHVDLPTDNGEFVNEYILSWKSDDTGFVCSEKEGGLYWYVSADTQCHGINLGHFFEDIVDCYRDEIAEPIIGKQKEEIARLREALSKIKDKLESRIIRTLSETYCIDVLNSID